MKDSLHMSAAFDGDGRIRCLMEGFDANGGPVHFELYPDDLARNLSDQLDRVKDVLATERHYHALLAIGWDTTEAQRVVGAMLPAPMTFVTELRARRTG